MRVEYSKRALSDLRRIAAYFAHSDDPAVGERIAEAIEELVEEVAQTPGRGRRVTQRPGVRVVLLVRYRYKVFFKSMGGTLRIVHIRHTSRRPWEGEG